MAINFPISASLNDTYTYNSKTWKWNGTAWEKSSSTETGNTEGNTGEVAYYSGKGSTIAGATAFFYDGDKVGIGTSGPTETLDVRGGITASGTLYAAGGVTFGGDVKVAGGGFNVGPDAGATLAGNIGLQDGSRIQDGGNNSIFELYGDKYFALGDVDSKGSSTLLTIRDTHSRITLDAGTSITLDSPSVIVPEDIQHHGDSDTKITFGTNKISMSVGGQTFLDTVYGAGSGTPIIAPYGITCGIGPAGVYTPHGITCGTLSVGGYPAFGQEEIIGILVDNGSTVLSTGVKGQRIIAWDCEVVEWTVSSSDSGAIEWDINWSSYSDWPTTASVGGLSLPSIPATNSKSRDDSVNWVKTTFNAGDIIEFEIDSVTTLTNCMLSLRIRRTS
jgi:hypothetical protein